MSDGSRYPPFEQLESRMFMNSRHSLQHSFCSPKFNCHVGPSSRRWCDNIDHTFTFLCFLLIDRTSGSCFFVPLLPRIRKRTKIVTLKWIFTTTKSRLPEVVILRKCLGKPQIRLKLQHIKGVSWLLAGPRASHPTESTDENSANHLIGECSKYKRNPIRLINSAGASWEFFVIYLESNWKVKKS